MGYNSLYLLAFLLSVTMYEALDVDNQTKTRAYKIAEESLEEKSLTASLPEGLCYVKHIVCTQSMAKKGEKSGLVCAYQKLYNLVNFANHCEIELQNCLYTFNRDFTGEIPSDPFIYNGKNKPCQYYMEQSKTLDEAVRLYREQ
ncbi:uncharacterized protein LOC142983550 [Anticarsia gemmatalis]|uniref:uncharacterized protein LOC142983550 n=1 Tax=Anticarsia gemmatalis TaxID=129554 RepID=UPI003F7681EA